MAWFPLTPPRIRTGPGLGALAMVVGGRWGRGESMVNRLGRYRFVLSIGASAHSPPLRIALLSSFRGGSWPGLREEVEGSGAAYRPIGVLMIQAGSSSSMGG